MSDRFTVTFGLACLALVAGRPGASQGQERVAQVEELTRMSLEDLAKVEVVSVAKAAQSLSEAPASIYVITREEMLRSGVQSIPEALRLAPNLQVTQWSASAYSVSARGFGDKRELQAFANKLLILIDGRTVYSPLFSGIFHDAQDVLMDDVDRIEVISGPGATLWGANAMNGVINIITRPASESAGALVRLGAGDQEQTANLRYGGSMGEATAYRVYAKGFERGSLELADGASARDRWNRVQGGFRTDSSWRNAALMVRADAYRSDQSQRNGPDVGISGATVVGRWTRATERSQLVLQAYVDRTERDATVDGVAFTVDTYDLEFQHSAQLGSAHRFIWGAGTRRHDYDISNTATLLFLPPVRSLDLTTVFAQDTIALHREWDLTLGVKLEENLYSDWAALPDVRLAWRPSSAALLWGAASRAIRSPTPFDVDVAEVVGGTLFVEGNPDFRNEELTAYEIGYRAQSSARVSLSASVFYHEYDDLRTIEPDPSTLLPLRWDNLLEGDTYGVEAWANLQVTPRWRLSPGLRTFDSRMQFKEGASGLVSVEQFGNDPRRQASLKSSLDLPRGLTFDAFLRYVGELPDPANPDYYELSARLGWQVSRALEVSVSGFNLLDERHFEYPAPVGAAVPRSVYAEARWTPR